MTLMHWVKNACWGYTGSSGRAATTMSDIAVRVPGRQSRLAGGSPYTTAG